MIRIPTSDRMRAGTLNRRITLMSPNATPDGTGFVPRDTMTAVRKIWADMEPTMGTEELAGLREVAERWVIVRCHYAAAKDATEGWWIQYVSNGVTENYDIRAILQINQARNMIQFMTRRVQ